MKQTIVAVANQKGGVGKTTTSVNVASGIAALKKKVLLIDLDPQANATSGLGIDKTTVATGTYQALFDDSTVASAILHTNAGIDLLASTPELAAAEVELVPELSREQRLLNITKLLDYDYIFIDCPPSLGLLTVNALTAANYVLIPVQAEYYAMEGLGQLLETMSRVKKALNQKLDLLGIVLTMFDSRTSLSTQVETEVKKHFPGRVFKTVIPRNVRLAEAPSFGKTVQQHDKWSKGARAYKLLSKEVVSKVEGA